MKNQMSLVPYNKQYWNDYNELADTSANKKSVSLHEEPIFFISGSVDEKRQFIIKAHSKEYFGMMIVFQQVL